MLKHIIYILDENFDKDTIVNEKETLIVTNNSYGADYANAHNIPVIACETNEFLSQYAIENHKDLDLEYANIVYNRHHGNPVVIFETQRLIVREMRISDLPSFYEMYEDEQIKKYNPLLSNNVKEEEDKLKAYINTVYPLYGYGIWTLVEKNSNQIIGRAGVENGDELQYMIKAEYRRCGYAKEAINAILEYMYLEMKMEDFTVKIHNNNLPSIKLINNYNIKATATENDVVIYKLKNQKYS